MRFNTLVWIGILLFLPGVLALTSERVDFTVLDDDRVEERVTLTIVTAVASDSVSFPLDAEPLAVVYDGSFVLENKTLTLNHSIRPGTNTVSFILLGNSSVRRNGLLRTFGASLNVSRETQLTTSLTLPPGFVLADTDPAVSPKPETLTTDGRSVVLTWSDYGPLDIIVLYEVPDSAMPETNLVADAVDVVPLKKERPMVVLLFVLAILCGFGVLGFFLTAKKKNALILMDALGPDEQAVVEFIRHGFRTQKQIAQQAGFSKSKMSKVVRKLEEKKVVRKEPHFKTNRLVLLPGWK